MVALAVAAGIGLVAAMFLPARLGGQVAGEPGDVARAQRALT
jgi:hypothetical protein